jgi:polyisoprenoid-binding protein YceI
MTTRYRFDPGQSRFTVRAFVAGMLSFLGHSPTFAVRDFNGEVTIGAGGVTGVSLTALAASLRVTDEVSAHDRGEIEGTMFREVLEAARFPQIAYAADEVTTESVAQGRYRLRIGGRLSLRGVARPQPLDAELLVFDDGIRLRGDTALRLSDYGIKPVTALGGTVRLKDELQVSFDLAGLPEGP